MKSTEPPRLAPRDVRRRAGWPKHRLALVAGCGVGLVTLFEANPSAVSDDSKRAKLLRVYADLRALVT